MAESVMTYLVKQAGLSDQFYINSAATSREEIGNPPHHGTVARLKAEGIPVIPHRAVQMTLDDYEEYDYLIGLDVADPWYTGDFEATYKDVKSGCEGLLHTLAEEIM